MYSGAVCILRLEERSEDLYFIPFMSFSALPIKGRTKRGRGKQQSLLTPSRTLFLEKAEVQA